MPARPKSKSAGVDLALAAELLAAEWRTVNEAAGADPGVEFPSDAALRADILASANHPQVSYRFCLLIQLLGKLTNSALDCLRLQKKKGDAADVTGWDARSLGSKVVAPFNQQQEGVLGTSNDPYVGNPMRIPRMLRDDASKKDIAGWNRLVGVLERVEAAADPQVTRRVFRQVLLEVLRRQQAQRFTYPLPPRVSLDDALRIGRAFLEEKSGGDRALALAGALFDSVGSHFGLFATVNRAKINTTDDASGQAADLECVDATGHVVLAVEVKDRQLTLADLEGTLQKSRRRHIRDIFFTAPATKPEDEAEVRERILRAFSAGQNLYRFEFFELARVVLALGGEPIR